MLCIPAVRLCAFRIKTMDEHVCNIAGFMGNLVAISDGLARWYKCYENVTQTMIK